MISDNSLEHLEFGLFSYETKVCSIFSGAGKFCLAHWLRRDSSHETLKLTSVVYKCSFTRHYAKRRMTFGEGRHTTLLSIFFLKLCFFQ